MVCWAMDQDPIKRWMLTVLAGAQQDKATELILSCTPEGGTAIRYRTGDTWHAWASAPEIKFPHMLAELGGLAGIREGAFPKEGIIYLAYSGLRLRWRVRMPSSDAECALQNLGEEMV